MGKTKKSEDAQTSEIAIVSSGIANFELNAEIVAGTLTSNAKELRSQIESELKNYSVEKYVNEPDAAKSDKALLNKVKESVAEKRKEITKAWNKPLDDFLTEMIGLENTIADASNQINEIVKQAKNQENDTKRKQIEEYWKTLDFTFVSLDRVFNPKWLNKTFAMKDIMLEIESITEKITSELSTIKSMNDEDSEVLQSFYLDTLDLNATLQKGNQLKANRNLLKEQAAKQVVNELVEQKLVPPENVPSELQAIIVDKSDGTKIGYEINASHNGVVQKDVLKYTLEIEGTRKQLFALKNFMITNGIKHNKVQG